jgi:hypothetical protein
VGATWDFASRTRNCPLRWRAECLRGPAAANGGVDKQDAPGAVAGLIGSPF